MQVHRSHCIALDPMDEVLTRDGRMTCQMIGGLSVPVSRCYQFALKAAHIIRASPNCRQRQRASYSQRSRSQHNFRRAISLSGVNKRASQGQNSAVGMEGLQGMLKVTIADQRLQFAEALSTYLHLKLDVVCTIASDYSSLCDLAMDETPDLILFSSRLPGVQSDRKFKRLRNASGSAQFVMMRERFHRFSVDEAELVAVVSKMQPAIVLVDIIITLLHGSFEAGSDQKESSWVQSAQQNLSKWKGWRGDSSKPREHRKAPMTLSGNYLIH